MADPVKVPSVEIARSWLRQARQLIERSRFMWLRAGESLKDAHRMQTSLHSHIEELANCGPLRPEFTTTILLEILDAVIEGTSSDRGNIQTYDRKTQRLRIRVHRGFREPFLEFFNSVHAGHAACGTALKSRGRVIVPDIANSPIFVGTEVLEVMLDAGVRAVQSTPLMGESGEIWGMLSTHYRTVTQPGKKDLALIDYFAGWAAEILEVEDSAAHSDVRSLIPASRASKILPAVLPSSED